jgi:hypothetical protein
LGDGSRAIALAASGALRALLVGRAVRAARRAADGQGVISGGVVASLLHRPAMNVKAYGLEAQASEWPGTQAKTHSCGSRLARALSEVRSEPSQSLRLGVPGAWSQPDASQRITGSLMVPCLQSAPQFLSAPPLPSAPPRSAFRLSSQVPSAFQSQSQIPSLSPCPSVSHLRELRVETPCLHATASNSLCFRPRCPVPSVLYCPLVHTTPSPEPFHAHQRSRASRRLGRCPSQA